ncbi:MAG: LysM peptidoglycan-binding domain-containing protein [Planctomycetota bacterium]|jgi:nucleoid-associated protein YgaU
MQKDLKIGLVLGLILVIVTGLWLTTGPGLNPEEARTQEPRESRTEHVDNNQLSIINNQSKLPDPAVYEQAEKIKTQKFHIVSKGETLSEISRKYYGSANKWQKILNANRNVISDANKLRLGTKLIIPE